MNLLLTLTGESSSEIACFERLDGFSAAAFSSASTEPSFWLASLDPSSSLSYWNQQQKREFQFDCNVFDMNSTIIELVGNNTFDASRLLDISRFDGFSSDSSDSSTSSSLSCFDSIAKISRMAWIKRRSIYKVHKNWTNFLMIQLPLLILLPMSDSFVSSSCYHQPHRFCLHFHPIEPDQMATRWCQYLRVNHRRLRCWVRTFSICPIHSTNHRHRSHYSSDCHPIVVILRHHFGPTKIECNNKRGVSICLQNYIRNEFN